MIIDIDKMMADLEPIQVRIDGKVLEVKTLDAALCKKLSEIESEVTNTADLHGVLSHQVSAFKGEPVESFANSDARQLKAIVSVVMNQVTKTDENVEDLISRLRCS